MKTKLTVLVTMLVLAVGAFFTATPAQGKLSLPLTGSHSERFCGSHHHHHGHYWSCGDREFWCPGHCD